MENENKNPNADTQTATNTNVPKEEQKENVNKNEGEKTKNKVAQKGEDGSIVFKNQDELDGFIRRMYAKGAEKAEQGETTKKVQETQEKQEETKTQDYTDKIALAMAKAGVDVKKVERAAKLADVSKILENGVLNAKNLEDEINAVLAEFPELKVAKEEEKEEKGFKFGADQGSTDKDKKQKRPTPTKRWNRFNSF